jgi:hypothetical protein
MDDSSAFASSPVDGDGPIARGGRELVLVAEVRDGDVVDQMTPEDGDLLDRPILLPRLSHGESPAEL